MERFLTSLAEGAIRTGGFFTKEVVTVVRQPRLIASLVLGPFLILMVFGLGYRGPHPEFRTVLVLPSDPAISDKVGVFQEGFAGVFRLQSVTRDRDQALAELKADRADVVVVVPDDVYAQIAAGNRATLQVIYTESDPTANGWVRYFGAVQTSELNRRILTEVLRESKGPASQALDYAAQALAETDALEADLRGGDNASAATRIDRLLFATRSVPFGLVDALDQLSGLRSGDVEDVDVGGVRVSESEPATDLLREIEGQLLSLRTELDEQSPGPAEALTRVEATRARLERYEALARQVNAIPVETLVSPLTAELQNVAPIEPTAVAFYTPAVIALLLQHIGVTLSSLSSVRDRLLGSQELFRVSPVGPGQILVGKSLGYGLLLLVVGAVLTWATTLLLGVPSIGDPLFYWLSIGVTIFAAVALGFALAILARTESQAVQLSMLVLLASVFFGGFFLPLNLMFPWVRAASYLLPVTYGAVDLRDVMLRGARPDWPFLLGPVALGLVFYLVALLGLRRQMRRA